MEPRAASVKKVGLHPRFIYRHLIEKVAVCLRRGECSHVSLDSALAEQGAIAQIPMSGLTVMTTGRSAKIMQDRPLRVARVETALRDLRRAGRNLDMVNREDYEDILRERAEAGTAGRINPERNSE